VLDSGDTGGRSRQACTALAEGCPASVVHREAVLTDHGCTCLCRRSDVLRHSVLAAAHQSIHEQVVINNVESNRHSA